MQTPCGLRPAESPSAQVDRLQFPELGLEWRDLKHFFIGACRRSEGRGRGHKVAHLAAGRDARRRDFDHGLDRGRCIL